MKTPAEIPLEKLLEALLDTDTPLHPRFLYRLSDLEPDELMEIQAAWPRLPAWRRQALMEDIENLNDTDMLLSFEPLARFTLGDEAPPVRASALRMLWDYVDPRLIPRLIKMMKDDPASEVRAAAANLLGRYVYEGELEELDLDNLRLIEDALLETFHGTDEDQVRRDALEALGFSSRDEVAPLIEKAFASEDKRWKASALFAMGRSATERWKPQVLSMLESNLPLLRSEAARAAGEIEIQEARPILIELLDDPDENTRQAAIWSLSQIGGPGIMALLQKLYETADETEIDLLESALDNLAFTEGVQMMPMLDFPEGDDEDWEADDEFELIEELLDDDEDDEVVDFETIEALIEEEEAGADDDIDEDTAV